jgi:Icc-related predicted phosphoesterase
MGARLLVFSDIHGDRTALQAALDIEADAYIAAGDLCTWTRGLDDLAPLLARRAERMWILPGNHENSIHIGNYCARHGFRPLHGTSFELGGYHVAGLGHSNPTPFSTPGEDSEATIAANLAPFAALQPLILVCHCPPFGTPLDEARPGQHFGSRSIAEFIAARQPDYFFCGHIHEAAGRETLLGRTRAFNAGKRGCLLEWPA